MSERFFFDIENGEETIRDEEGAEAASLEEALTDARSVIREMTGEIGGDDLDVSWVLMVRDATGTPVARLSVRIDHSRSSHSEHESASSRHRVEAN